MDRHFDGELMDLKNDLMRMASFVQEAIADSLDALRTLSKGEALEIINDDKKIDEWELKVDEECLELLALRQPMAVDLRFITMAMKISTDLERMADLAVDIAQRVLELADKPLLKPLEDIPKLSQLAQLVIKDVIEAFVKKDPDMAGKVILLDKEADKLRNQVQKELIEYMVKDGTTVSRAVPLLLIARHLERICDHATNIAEDIIYMVKAKVVKHHPEELNNRNP